MQSFSLRNNNYSAIIIKAANDSFINKLIETRIILESCT